MSDTDSSGAKRQTEVIYRLLKADGYWKALSSIKAIDQSLSGLEEKEIVNRGPQTEIAASLLNLLDDFEEKNFLDIWNDYETAIPSAADHELRTLNTEVERGDRPRTDGGRSWPSDGAFDGTRVYASQGGDHYHEDRDCSHLPEKSALHWDKSAAWYEGMDPCDDCATLPEHEQTEGEEQDGGEGTDS